MCVQSGTLGLLGVKTRRGEWIDKVKIPSVKSPASRSCQSRAFASHISISVVFNTNEHYSVP